ncbi:MAG TPA: alginate lyase family protein, partial [Pyrinomonadaceae bacterium]
FTHQPDVAKKVLESAKQNRITKQIEPDGGQPRELARTKSWSYSTMNLDGMVELEQLGDAAGVDLWGFQTSDGRSVRKAIDYLFPFATGDQKWTHQQIEEFQPERLYTIMRRAARAYHDDGYNKMMAKVPTLADNDERRLLMF